MDKKDKDEGLSIAFNGSVQTLDRINDLLVHCSLYAVNDHILGYYRNLKELFKESQGFLSQAELKTAWNKWEKVRAYTLAQDTENNLIVDSELFEALEGFDFWIRKKLHNHKVTMALKQEWLSGMEKINRRYKLDVAKV